MSKLHSFFRSVWSQKRTLKIYLDGDLVFYSIDFNELPQTMSLMKKNFIMRMSKEFLLS